tara:strand:+ start:65 stop:1330 length:1266 start_codon:yes stop_codon:yes gene_type:complete
MAVKEVNGVSRHAIKSINDNNMGTIKAVGSDPATVLDRAMCWTVKYADGSSNNWLLTHTASGFDPANPTAQLDTNYAPSSSWAAFWQGGYGGGGMSAQTFGEDSQGNYWWGAVRYNDVGRCFMHDTGTLVVDGNDDRIETHGVWPNDATMTNSRWQEYVIYGALDKVWIVGKGSKNVESMAVSYSDPKQSNDQMSWTSISNLQGSSNTNKCQPVYCGGRKYAALQGNNFFINTGTLSSSVETAADWVQQTDPGTATDDVNWMAYGEHPEHPEGVFVVLGGGSQEIKISNDNGNSWSDATVHGGGTAREMTSVCYDTRRRQFIAVGVFGRILTSSASDVTKWAVAGGNSDHNGDAGNTHYGVRTDGYNVVVTGLNVIKVSTGSLEVFETIPNGSSQTSGQTLPSTADSYFMFGATPAVIRAI